MLRWNEAQLEAFRALRKGSASIPVKLEERAKYRNKKTTVDGKKFDSKLEARRYVELKRLEAAKVISGLRCQVPYALEVNGNLICRYVADFVYRDIGGSQVVEDAKGMLTRDYILKRKLMKACHGITILETKSKKATARPISRGKRKGEEN